MWYFFGFWNSIVKILDFLYSLIDFIKTHYKFLFFHILSNIKFYIH